jgi:hypothetical protein
MRPDKIAGAGSLLAAAEQGARIVSRYFELRLRLARPGAPCPLRCSRDLPAALLFLEGRGLLGEREVTAGRTVLLPACLAAAAGPQIATGGDEPLVWIETWPTADA